MKKRIFTLISAIAIMAAAAQAAAPKYIFYFIGDGMGVGHVMAAQSYCRTTQGKPLLMMQFPVVSFTQSYSSNSTITDSAAAGTALSTGSKTNNGMLGMDSDTLAVTSIARYLKDKGYGVGITTSVPIDDATPAAFYAHVPKRGMYNDITRDLAASGYDFFAGSILRGNANTDSIVRSGGYSIYHGLDEYNAGPKQGKTLVLNPKNITAHQITYTIDSVAGAMTLPQITEAAIAHLEKESPKKFFLMVEGGNIDWAAHSNDAGGVVKEIINFNEAIALAYDFYLKHPKETLIVVTADHDTGAMALGQMGNRFNIRLGNYDLQRVSKDVFMEECRNMLKDNNVPTWGEMKEILAAKTGLYGGIEVKDDESKNLEQQYTEVFVNRDNKEYKTLYNSFNGFVESVFKLLDRKSGTGWTTTYHCGNVVPVFAIGAGAQEFSGTYNNTEIPRRIAKLTGVNMK